MITLSNIQLRRGQKVLLDDAELVVHPGQHIGIIGANGSGKSTLFKLLMGQVTPDAGDLFIPSNWRVAHMAQELANSENSALDFVLDGDPAIRAIERAIEQALADGDNDRLALEYEKMDAANGFDAHYRAEQLLHGLGFAQSEVNRPVNSFSGGWRIRLNLAQALMSPSDLMLLDEPTNHLDLDATLWLEQWLKSYAGTLLIISHDRDFIDNVVERIVHIDQQKANAYKGNYSMFERVRSERLALQQASFEKQQKRRKEVEDFITRFKAKASKAKQAQSRVKELARMEEIAPAHIDSPFYFSFPTPKKAFSALVNISQADLGYDKKTILNQVNFDLHPGTRIGLLGPNGAGKSTLINSLTGDLGLLSGNRVYGENVKIGYFAQHQLEVLDLQASAFLHIQRISPKSTDQEIRNYLGSFDFHGDKALEPIKDFSGGEKARVALALIVWQKPNLLLLDEPTNHLDLEMRQALTMALQGYEGALVVISHDRHLLRNTVDQFYLVANGEVQEFDGDLQDYQVWLKNYNRTPDAQVKNSVPDNSVEKLSGAEKKAQRQQSAEARKKIAPLNKKSQQLEKEIETNEKQLADVEHELADTDLYTDAKREALKMLLDRQAKTKKEIADKEAEWLEIQTQIEAMS
ncbi:MAG: ATP-binding cassette domain-containing protein [Porticoccaceae bacterium]|jgi:ATP-binding cassette, subfamily F, member 3|nr:ATP-binding cassette domain-containing protein [Alphaproteobacteria bacterium]MDP4745919.1 ATP-binding cassette domain-containing protein [Porticoccaceae bacterium]MDP4753679.1 ATP-binding cassette domain-containing protein [Porticoccaceae bacterium]MDP4890732.1 ATP-binding cassette domain-containing protein [Porticoccaceae bacterium]